MDKINEILTCLMVTVFGWLAANKTMPVGDYSNPEVAPAAGPSTPDVVTAAISPTDKIYNDRFHEGTVIAAGLSEMLNHSKVRRNMRRRKEDQRSV